MDRSQNISNKLLSVILIICFLGSAPAFADSESRKRNQAILTGLTIGALLGLAVHKANAEGKIRIDSDHHSAPRNEGHNNHRYDYRHKDDGHSRSHAKPKHHKKHHHHHAKHSSKHHKHGKHNHHKKYKSRKHRHHHGGYSYYRS